MSSEKLNDMFGPCYYENNDTIFHLIARDGADRILERIMQGTEGNELKPILSIKNNQGETSVHTAAKNLRGFEAENLIVLMLERGADMNDQEDGTGNTALHIAVQQRDYHLVEWLMSLPMMNMDIVNDAGFTPYQLALENKDQQMIQVIITAQAERENEANEEADTQNEDLRERVLSLMS